jgi:hypothetical protein
MNHTWYSVDTCFSLPRPATLIQYSPQPRANARAIVTSCNLHVLPLNKHSFTTKPVINLTVLTRWTHPKLLLQPELLVFLDFTHLSKNTTFRQLDLFPSSGESVEGAYSVGSGRKIRLQ